VFDLDWPIIRMGATAGLIVVIPAAIISALLVDDNDASSWAPLFEIVVIFGFVIAGWGAGSRRPDTPMMHGAAAAFLCYVVVQLFGFFRRLAQGADINFLTYPIQALLAATFGVAGAVFADWYRRKSLRTSSS
jgi:hypothetical protein